MIFRNLKNRHLAEWRFLIFIRKAKAGADRVVRPYRLFSIYVIARQCSHWRGNPFLDSAGEAKMDATAA